MLCQKKQKIKKLQFLNQLPLSFSDLDTHGLTSHVDKLVKLLFFKAENIAISFSVFFVVFNSHQVAILHVVCFKYIDTYFKRKNSLNSKRMPKP